MTSISPHISQQLPSQCRGKANKFLRFLCLLPSPLRPHLPRLSPHCVAVPLGSLLLEQVGHITASGPLHSHIPLPALCFPRHPCVSSLPTQASIWMSPSQRGLPSPLECGSPEGMALLKMTAFVSFVQCSVPVLCIVSGTVSVSVKCIEWL